MKKSRGPAVLLTGLLLLVGSVPAVAAPKGWETVRTERVESKSVVRDQELEVKVTAGSIIIVTGHAVQVKVVTILGRTVTSETLQPGTWQFVVPAHGVYIVKVGDITCKVAL